MKVAIFAINLDRSADRWQRLSDRATELGLPITRISAVDGTLTPEGDREDVDDAAFRTNAGRLMLAGEYGCYRSHINALQAFLKTDVDVALIIEDDIELTDDICDRTAAAFDAVPKADVIKLINHRVVGFRQVATSRLGDRIGRAIHGPLGSAACYGVTRRGAEMLIKHLKVMRHPWDAALERGWHHGAEVFVSSENITTINRTSTTIATRKLYRSVKLPKWRRVRTYLRRLRDDAHRLAYALAR